MVGTMPPCSILWIAAAETSDRSPSCCRDRPIRLRWLNTFRPMDPTMRSTSPEPVVSLRPLAWASRQGGPWVRGTRFIRSPSGSRAPSLDVQVLSRQYSVRLIADTKRRVRLHEKRVTMAQRIVVIGGGAAGIGAAGAAKGTNPSADV